jgi:hypothetical protein
MTHDTEQFALHANGGEQTNVRSSIDAQNMLQTIRETVEALVTPLREQLEAERGRTDRERDRADRAERRVTELLAEQRAAPPRRSWLPWRRS